MSDSQNIDTVYALATGRKTYFQPDLEDYERHRQMGRAHERSDEKANLVSSEVRDGVHMPVIDCDFGIQAIASSTPGHYHLYVDKEMSWEQYKALLKGMFEAGLIQKGWYENALKDGRSYVRLPHVRKTKPGKPEDQVSNNILNMLQMVPAPTNNALPF